MILKRIVQTAGMDTVVSILFQFIARKRQENLMKTIVLNIPQRFCLV